MKATVRAVALTLLAVVTSYVSGCRPSIETRTYAQGSVFTPVAQLAEFTENSVRVTLSLESDQQRHPILRATFAPTEAGLHLYGKDLPEAGIQGIGVPTRLDVPPQSSITPAGSVFTDASPHDERFDALGITLQIYPEGPVTLRQPIQVSSTDGAVSAQVFFSYMACQSNGSCRLPVRRRAVEVHFPNHE